MSKNFSRSVKNQAEPNLKELFSFLIFGRGLLGMIAISWGLMTGGAALLTFLVLVLARMGLGYWPTLGLSLATGALGIIFASPAMRNEYYRPNTQGARGLVRLYFVAIFYGLICPIIPLYLSAEVAFKRWKLIRSLRKGNLRASELKITYQKQHREIMETKQKAQDLSKKAKSVTRTLPHIYSQAVTIKQNLENLRMDVRNADEQADQILLDYRRIANELRIKLEETPTGWALPANATFIRLTRGRIGRTYITDTNGLGQIA